VAWCEKQPGRQGGLSGTVWTVGSMWVVRGSTVGGVGNNMHGCYTGIVYGGQQEGCLRGRGAVLTAWVSRG
jgi:hypothetical protein